MVTVFLVRGSLFSFWELRTFLLIIIDILLDIYSHSSVNIFQTNINRGQPEKKVQHLSSPLMDTYEITLNLTISILVAELEDYCHENLVHNQECTTLLMRRPLSQIERFIDWFRFARLALTESWTVEIYISYTLLLMDPDQLNFGIKQFERGQISTV